MTKTIQFRPLLKQPTRPAVQARHENVAAELFELKQRIDNGYSADCIIGGIRQMQEQYHEQGKELSFKPEDVVDLLQQIRDRIADAHSELVGSSSPQSSES